MTGHGVKWTLYPDDWDGVAVQPSLFSHCRRVDSGLPENVDPRVGDERSTPCTVVVVVKSPLGTDVPDILGSRSGLATPDLHDLVLAHLLEGDRHHPRLGRSLYGPRLGVSPHGARWFRRHPAETSLCLLQILTPTVKIQNTGGLSETLPTPTEEDTDPHPPEHLDGEWSWTGMGGVGVDGGWVWTGYGRANGCGRGVGVDGVRTDEWTWTGSGCGRASVDGQVDVDGGWVWTGSGRGRGTDGRVDVDGEWAWTEGGCGRGSGRGRGTDGGSGCGRGLGVRVDNGRSSRRCLDASTSD